MMVEAEAFVSYLKGKNKQLGDSRPMRQSVGGPTQPALLPEAQPAFPQEFADPARIMLPSVGKKEEVNTGNLSEKVNFNQFFFFKGKQ